METVISTLDTPNLTTVRRDGNSTRQINFTIENLFKGYTVLVKDHFKHDKFVLNDFLLKRIQKRLYKEHNIDYKDCIITKTDQNCYSVKLKL